MTRHGEPCSRALTHLALCLLDPERHVHLPVYGRRAGHKLLSPLGLTRAPEEFAEAEVAVGDQGAHAARLGEVQCLAVAGFPALGLGPIGMAGDVGEQVPGMGREPGLRLRALDRAIGEAARLGDPAKKQADATQRSVIPGSMSEDSRGREAIEEMLALPEPG